MPALLVAILGELADVLLGYVLKEPNPPGIVPKLLSRVMLALSKTTGETPEQTEERRARAEAIFAAHSKPIGGAE